MGAQPVQSFWLPGTRSFHPKVGGTDIRVMLKGWRGDVRRKGGLGARFRLQLGGADE